MKRKRLYILLLIIGLSIIAVVFILVLRIPGEYNTANVNKKISDGFGLFGEGDATLPCWWKICIGTQMPREKLEDLIQGDKQISHYIYTLDASLAEFVYTSVDGKKSVWVIFPTSIDLHTIDVTLVGTYSVSTNEVIDTYGQPTYIGVYKYAFGHEASLLLYYPKLRTYFGTIPVIIDNNEVVLTNITGMHSMTITSLNPLGNSDIKWYKWSGYKPYRVD
ncbi:MAG: hypothetical protein ACYC6L_12310 [Anaerolineae bacterium]